MAAVEGKVTAATVASTITGLVVTWLGATVFHGAMSAPLVGVIGAVVTGAVTFAAGWLSRHTPRPPDVPPAPPVPPSPTNLAA